MVFFGCLLAGLVGCSLDTGANASEVAARRPHHAEEQNAAEKPCTTFLTASALTSVAEEDRWSVPVTSPGVAFLGFVLLVCALVRTLPVDGPTFHPVPQDRLRPCWRRLHSARDPAIRAACSGLVGLVCIFFCVGVPGHGVLTLAHLVCGLQCDHGASPDCPGAIAEVSVTLWPTPGAVSLSLGGFQRYVAAPSINQAIAALATELAQSPGLTLADALVQFVRVLLPWLSCVSLASPVLAGCGGL